MYWAGEFAEFGIAVGQSTSVAGLGATSVFHSRSAVGTCAP